MINVDVKTDCIAKEYINAHNNLKDNIELYETGESLVGLECGPGDIGFFDHSAAGLSYRDLHNITEQTVAISVEGLHYIVPYLDQIPSDKKYIFMCHNQWDPDAYQFPFEYTVVECNFHFWDRLFTHFNLYNFNMFTPLHYNFDCNKPYHFYAPVGQKRYPRDTIVDLLQQSSYSNYILRYQGVDLGQTDYERLAIESTRDGQKFDHWRGLPGFEKHYVTLSEMIPLKTMNQARLTVPVETQITYLHSFFYTEKSIKCLITGAPFVCYSNQYHMKNLRSLGFETYHSLWDESYDNIQDHDQRAQAIMDLLELLRNFDWEAAKPEFLRIKHHNMYNIFNLRDRERKVFVQNSDRLKKFLGRE
jgi:hypothetical protein